ncbi:hypothetical protein YW7DRAFT_00963 [Streptomyces sp. AmelKG-E11A]|nr:hypothetical protein YW7DRAFT_00963 [Streptomyces sp. AmelKG-E11A]
MKDHGISSNGLAERVNEAIGKLTGRAGGLDDSSVRGWRSGRVRWPNAATRLALEMVTGHTAEELGFVPRGKAAVRSAATTTEGRSVDRRDFMSKSAGALAVPAVVPTGRLTVGNSDVQRLRDQLARLYRLDDKEGGGLQLEKKAVALSASAMKLQNSGSATTQVRSRLYALGASFTAAALWAAIDSHRLDDAQRHLEKAITLAGLSGDGQVQHEIWRYASSLADQGAQWTDAIAASEASMLTTAHRRDPLYASFSNARLALALARQEPARARRALDRAAAAFTRADLTEPRPASMSVYTEGELSGLTGIVQFRCGAPETAEYHLHQCLAALRPDQHRNRAIYTAHTARAQLAQGDIDQACATATRVVPPPGSPDSGRTLSVLRAFTGELTDTAPDAAATRDWLGHMRASQQVKSA